MHLEKCDLSVTSSARAIYFHYNKDLRACLQPSNSASATVMRAHQSRQDVKVATGPLAMASDAPPFSLSLEFFVRMGIPRILRGSCSRLFMDVWVAVVVAVVRAVYSSPQSIHRGSHWRTRSGSPKVERKGRRRVIQFRSIPATQSSNSVKACSSVRPVSLLCETGISIGR